MKKIIKFVLMIAVLFMGTGTFAASGGYIQKFFRPEC